MTYDETWKMPPYGSPEYFERGFSDYLADVESPEIAMQVLQGFEMAINSWLEYHETQARNYRDLMRQFQTSSFPPAEVRAAEEAELPKIPEIPSVLK